MVTQIVLSQSWERLAECRNPSTICRQVLEWQVFSLLVVITQYSRHELVANIIDFMTNSDK